MKILNNICVVKQHYLNDLKYYELTGQTQDLLLLIQIHYLLSELCKVVVCQNVGLQRLDEQ